jgi:hypothetical protein
MPINYAKLQQALTFDHLMRSLDEHFQTLPDYRKGNAVSYQLPDVLKEAFAMFSLKSPSLLDFKTQTTAEEKNLHYIYRIQGAIPCDNQMRGILDRIDPHLLRPLFQTLFTRLSDALYVKPDSHKSLEKQFAGRLSRRDVKQLRLTDEEGLEHYFAWTSNLVLNSSSIDVRVNYLLYEQTAKDGQVTRWTWITNLRLTARSVVRVMRAGRARWKIESVPQANRKEAQHELTNC